MSKSVRRFERWTAVGRATWPYRIFQKFNDELHQILNTHLVSREYLYQNLKAQGASWQDRPNKFFDPKGRDFELYDDLKQWSDAYNHFSSWVTLSRILTVSSTIETYLASVIGIALESDPGLVLGVSRSIDGAAVLKHTTRKGIDSSDYVEACTKGNWSARIDAFESMFAGGPRELRAAHSSLEEIRGIRNRFGHAFGRDIDEARKHGVLKLIPMERIQERRANKLWKDASVAIKAVDDFLLKNHIGDFEAVRFYHFLYPSLRHDLHVGERVCF